MINQESKPTIEDLLRLKRAERPAPAFWEEFDRELRAKQLAALVEKRPWWRALPRSLGGLTRYHLPLGATAVLAVTLLSIRDFQPVQPNPNAALTDYEAAKAAAYYVPAANAEDTAAVAEDVPPAEAPATVVAPTPALSSEATSPGQLARMVPLLSTADATATEIRPSARSIAENRAVAEVMLGTTTSGFETRALPTRSIPTEPLAQMANPADARRSRFAAAFAAAAVTASPAPTARVARRLSDEQLYDSIHRFGASGNSVSFKF